MSTITVATLAPIDQSIIDEFNIISAYFVDVFLNDRYNRAKDLWQRSDKVSNITEGYYQAIYEYIELLKENQVYINTIQGISAKYHKWTRHKSMSISTTVDHLVQFFVPQKFFHSMKIKERENSVHAVIKSVIKKMSELIIKSKMKLVIDNHSNNHHISQAIVELRQDCGAILREERDMMFCRFSMSQNNIRHDGEISKEKVALVKMKEMTQKLLDNQKILQDNLEKAKVYIKTQHDKIHQLVKQLKESKTIISLRDAELAKVNKQLTETLESQAQHDVLPEEEELDNAEVFDPEKLFDNNADGVNEVNGINEVEETQDNNTVASDPPPDFLVVKQEIPEENPDNRNFDINQIFD